MGIEGWLPLYFPKTLGYERGSVDRSPKGSQYHLINPKYAFINPLIRLYKRLFPLGHKIYLIRVISPELGA